ncbi:MAG: IS110 family transposase [Pseudomonadota bacterium]
MTRYIGVDLHTNSFTACILQAGQQEIMQTWPLQEGGLARFIATLQAGDEVAAEATGNSAWFCREVSPHVKRVVVIAPWQFEVIRRSVKKTDRHDARSIAFFLSKDMLPEARCKSEEQTQLASLIATRDQLVKLRVSLPGPVHGLFVRHGLKVKRETLTSQAGFRRHVESCQWSALEKAELEVIGSQLDALREGAKRLEKEIATFAKTLPGYANLISIKGIGPLSAAVMLTHIGEIKDFGDTGKLAAYFGIVPRVSQSNASCNTGRITKRGSKIARTTLVQCTLIAKRYSPYLHDFYERIKTKRGTGKAIIATARKLLNTIFHTLKNNWVFQDFPNFKLLPCNQS